MYPKPVYKDTVVVVVGGETKTVPTWLDPPEPRKFPRCHMLAIITTLIVVALFIIAGYCAWLFFAHPVHKPLNNGADIIYLQTTTPLSNVESSRTDGDFVILDYSDDSESSSSQGTSSGSSISSDHSYSSSDSYSFISSSSSHDSTSDDVMSSSSSFESFDSINLNDIFRHIISNIPIDVFNGDIGSGDQSDTSYSSLADVKDTDSFNMFSSYWEPTKFDPLESFDSDSDEERSEIKNSWIFGDMSFSESSGDFSSSGEPVITYSSVDEMVEESGSGFISSGQDISNPYLRGILGQSNMKIVIAGWPEMLIASGRIEVEVEGQVKMARYRSDTNYYEWIYSDSLFVSKIWTYDALSNLFKPMVIAVVEKDRNLVKLVTGPGNCYFIIAPGVWDRVVPQVMLPFNSEVSSDVTEELHYYAIDILVDTPSLSHVTLLPRIPFSSFQCKTDNSYLGIIMSLNLAGWDQARRLLGD